MKKLIIRIAVVVVVLIVLAVGVSIFYLGSIVKKGVETVGPTITKTDMKVNTVTLSLLSGKARFIGMVVGNPEGYKSESAIKMGSFSASVQPSSVFSDKILVKSINIQGPEITFEGGLRGSNLKKLLDNVEAASGGDKTAVKSAPDTSGTKAQKKLQVDEFVLTGGKIHLSLTDLGGKSVTVPLPDMRLTDLGKDPNGITAAELTKKVLTPILESAIKAAASAITDIGKGATEAIEEIKKNPADAAGKAAKGVTDLFKKKP